MYKGQLSMFRGETQWQDYLRNNKGSGPPTNYYGGSNPSKVSHHSTNQHENLVLGTFEKKGDDFHVQHTTPVKIGVNIRDEI